ncbi:MAG: type II toxin-antitoxin system MqsA family antitoxin [bacterium]|nr:type II toxin-antitoxin system MqsA family antitoxin [bacterium]
MAETIRCHSCGGDMVRDVRTDTVEYKDVTKTVEQPGWYCSQCEEVVFDGADAAVSEEVFIRLKADLDGILTPKEVRAIREKLGLSQRAAGQLLGASPKSFQKYEAGTVWVSRSMANLLRLLNADPDRLKEIAQARGRRSPRPRPTARARAHSPATERRRVSGSP